jgi:hypothetical protein
MYVRESWGKEMGRNVGRRRDGEGGRERVGEGERGWERRERRTANPRCQLYTSSTSNNPFPQRHVIHHPRGIAT